MAMLLFLRPTPMNYYFGHIAIQVTSDAHSLGVFHVFTNYPAY
jgi:hypothetical protein